MKGKGMGRRERNTRVEMRGAAGYGRTGKERGDVAEDERNRE